MMETTALDFTGRWMKSKAPSERALRVDSMSPWAVIMMTVVSGWLFRRL